MSIVMSPANPDQAEARVKTTSPAKYSFFGPNRSPSRPVMSNGTAYASKYALVTQTTLLMSVRSPVMTAGVATNTIVVSTMIMKKPSTSAQRAGHGLAMVSMINSSMVRAHNTFRLFCDVLATSAPQNGGSALG